MKKKTFSIKEALSFGWKKEQSKPLFFAGIILVMIITSILFGVVSDAAENSNFFVRIGINAVSMIAFLFLSLGIRKITLNAYDNKELKFSDIFSQEKLLISAIGATIIYVTLVFVGSLVLIIPGIFLFCRFFFVEVAIVDKGMGAIGSLRDSWRITKGNVLKILFFLLILLAINILGALAFLVGLLVTVPITALSLTYVYRKLSEVHSIEELEEAV